MKKDPIKLIAVISSISTTKDGGYKLSLECGTESLDAIQSLLTLNSQADMALAVAIVPFQKDAFE